MPFLISGGLSIFLALASGYIAYLFAQNVFDAKPRARWIAAIITTIVVFLVVYGIFQLVE